jgi:hypothetical protein
MIKLRNYPKGRKWSYSTNEIGQRAERLTADILHELAKAKIPAVGDIDSNQQYRITLTVNNEPFEVVRIQELFERGSSTGKFKFDFLRVHVDGIYGVTCRKYEQNELSKQHSLTKVVSILKDRYLAIQSAQHAAKSQEDTKAARSFLVKALRKEYPRLSRYILENDRVDVEICFKVDASTARMLLNALSTWKPPK